MFIVELEKGVYLADLPGDPGRTLDKSNAQTFETREQAYIARRVARKYRPFLFATIHEI